MKVKQLIEELESYLPNQEVNVEIHDKNKHTWYVADRKSVGIEVHTNPKRPLDMYIYGAIEKQKYGRWFCKKHGMEGAIGGDWCFGCYKFNEDTEEPVPYIGYKK